LRIRCLFDLFPINPASDRIEYTQGEDPAMPGKPRVPEERLPDISPAVTGRLCGARSVVVLTGSGMSAESGIPTFRDALTGLWSRFRPEELATPQAFAQDPARVWLWYVSRRERVAAAQPHAGYAALSHIERLLGRMTIVTQNVDGLHRRAGSGRVLELHGNIMRSVCSVTGKPIDDELIRAATDVPPRSPHAEDGLARPDVVWFGEMLPAAVLDAAVQALRSCDACLAIGTSALVEPAASLPLLARESGAMLVEINPAETPLSQHADHCLRYSASVALTALAHALQQSAPA
jgi:NAD-dependent deacetylase